MQPYLHPQQPYAQGINRMGGPPPAKRPRGNPIITRYPPPPGYTGPRQPFNQLSWQAPPYGHAPQAHPYPQYPQHNGATPMAYGQAPPYQPYPQFPQQVAPSPQHPCYPPQQPAHHPPAPNPWPVGNGWQAPDNNLRSAPAAPLQHTFEQQQQRLQQRHNSAPFPPTTNNWSGPLDAPGPSDSTTGGSDELESEYHGECYYARYPDDINPDLSLGMIEWHAPKPRVQALPATFKEAELDDIAPRPPLPSDSESVSKHFIVSKRDESFVSVRQTDRWPEIAHDTIFKYLPVHSDEHISKSRLVVHYRDRFDPAWTESARSPSPEPSREPSPDPASDVQDAPQGRNGEHVRHQSRASSAKAGLGQPGVLDDLEQALISPSAHDPWQISNTRTSSGTRGSLSHQNSLPAARDEQQEDILAALGVTGSPKKVIPTPGPASGPPPVTTNSQLQKNSPQTNETHEPQSFRQRASSVYSNGHISHPMPPNGVASEPNGINGQGKRPVVWRNDQRGSYGNGHHRPTPQNGTSGTSLDRPTSSHSTHTAVGGDFDLGDEATPWPPLERSGSNRKRSYEDSDHEEHNGNRQSPHGQNTRKQPRVSDTFQRRW